MRVQIHTFADVLAALDTIEDQCAAAGRDETNSIDIQQLWLIASISIGDAMRRIEAQQKRFMESIKSPYGGGSGC